MIKLPLRVSAATHVVASLRPATQPPDVPLTLPPTETGEVADNQWLFHMRRSRRRQIVSTLDKRRLFVNGDKKSTATIFGGSVDET